MKILIVLLSTLVSTNLYGQFDPPPQSVNTELNVQIFNNFNEYTVDFVLEPPSRQSDWVYNREYFRASQGCSCPPLYNQNQIWPDLTRTVSLEGEVNLCLRNGFGIGLSSSPVFPHCDGWPNGMSYDFQIALYRVNIFVNGVYKTHFWYDNREDHWVRRPECVTPANPNLDMSVRYDVYANKLYYWDTHYDVEELGENYFVLYKGETINWWEVMGLTYIVNYFPERYFAILSAPVRVNNSPFLTWQVPNVSASIARFELQRAWGESGFQTIYTTTSGTSYLDYEIF